MSKPKLSIVIVNWNVAPLLKRCISSIQAQLHDLSYEVIVVDNASEDGSQAMLKTQFPWIRLIENGENLGFAKANNQAFRCAQGEFILILNPDTELRPGAIQTLINLLEEEPQIGLVGPKVTTTQGEIVRACRRPNISIWEIAKGLFLTDKAIDLGMRRLFPRWWAQIADRKFQKSGRTDCLQGSCMLMRHKDLLQVGYFDERIPLYLDDNDLCQRFRDANFWVYYAANSHIIHVGAQSVGKMSNSRLSSMVGCLAIDTFFLKHGHAWQVFVYHLMLFFSSIIFLIVDLFLLPFLWFSKRDFIRNYFIKHYWSLLYSVTFQFKTKALPPSWPRSLKEALAAPVNDRPDPKKLIDTPVMEEDTSS